MQQVEAAHGQQQQFECTAPRGIFYNGTWYNTQALQLPSYVLPETWQWQQQQQQQQQQQYAHGTSQPGLHLQQGLQLVVAEVTPQLPLQSSRSHYQICTCQRGQPLAMLHGLHFVQPHQCNNYEAVIKQEQQQQHLQQLTAQHIQTPLMPQFSQQFHQQLEQQQQPQHFIQQQLELTNVNQQPQCFYSTQVQGTDSPQQEIQQELTQQELQLQQEQQHFIQQQHSNQQQHFQQQLPQQQLHLELQQQQHFIQWQQNSNQCCYSTQVEVAQFAQKEMQQQLPQQQLESQELQQHEQHTNQQEQQQYCYSTQFQQQQQLQQQLEHQTQSQQQLQQAQLQQQQLESQQLEQHKQDSNEQPQQKDLEQCCYSTQVQDTQSSQQQMQQKLEQQSPPEQQFQQQPHFVQQQLESEQLEQHQQQQCCYSTQFQQQQQLQQQFEHQTQSQQQLQQAQPQQQQLDSQQLEQHQQDSNEQQQLEQCCYSTQVESPQKEMQQELPHQQLESQELQQHQQDSNQQPQQKDLEQYCYLTQVQDTQSPQQQKLEQQSPPERQFQQQPHFVQQQLESEQLQQHQQQQCCHSTQLQQSHPQQQQQSVICQQHYLPDQTNNYRPQSSSTTPTSFPSSPSPSSISTPQPVNDPQIIQVDMSSVSKVHITRTFARLVISIYRQTELDDESPNRVIINGQVLISDTSDSSNGQSMSQLHVNSATQTRTETSMSTDASDEVDSSTADLEELLQYTTAAVATGNQSKSNAQTEPEQFRAPRRVAKQQPMLQHNPLKKAPKWTKPAKRISRELLNSSGSNETLPNRIQQENEQMPHENSEGILEKLEVVNSETILKESSTNLQKVEQKQMQQEESRKVLQSIEQVQMPQKRSETIQQKIEQIPLPKKKSTTNLHKIKEKEMLQENSDTILQKIEKMPQKSLETNLQKIEQIPIQQKDSGRILQKIDEVGVPQKEPRTNLNNIKEKQMTQKKPETILQKIEQMPLPQNESTTNVQKIEQILKEKSGRILQKIDQMPQEKPTTVKVQTISVTARLQDSDSNNSNNLFKQTTLGMASQQPQLALEICNHLGQQDRDREEEWPDLSVQQTTPSVRIRKSQPSPSPQPIVNQKCNGMRSPPSFPEDYPIGEPKLPQSIYKQMYKRKSSQSKTIEQSTSMMTTKQETPLRSQSVDNVKRSCNTKTYQRIIHNSDECPQLNGIRQILSPTRRNQSAQSYQSLVNQQKNLTRYQQGATKPITIKPTMNTLSKAQSITVHQSDINQAAARNDQVVNQPMSSSMQASIQSTSAFVKAGNQKQKSTPKAMSKVKSEQQPNINQTVNLKSQSAPRFGLNESKTSKSITDLHKKKSNGAFESNANQATDAKESEVHQSINLSADNEKPVKTFACSESENQCEVSLNPEMDNDTKPSTSQNAEALGIRKTNNNRKQKTRMSKFERKALRRELQNVQMAARKSEENTQSMEEVLQPVEVQHDVEEVKRNQQSTEVDQQPMEWESSDEIKLKEEPKETEPSDEDPELNNPLLSGISCKIMRGHILRIAKKINSL